MKMIFEKVNKPTQINFRADDDAFADLLVLPKRCRYGPRRQLKFNPAGQCRNSGKSINFLEEIRQDTEHKQQLQKDKEDRKETRQRLAAEKKNEREEKKRLRDDKKRWKEMGNKQIIKN